MASGAPTRRTPGARSTRRSTRSTAATSRVSSCMALAYRGLPSAGGGRAGRLSRNWPRPSSSAWRSRIRSLGDAPGHRPPVGDAADGRRRAVPGHAAVPGGRHRRAYGGDVVGPQPAGLRVRQPAAAVSLEPSRCRLLGGRRRGANRLGDGRRVPDGRRCAYRAARHRLRRQRAREPGERHPAGAREPEPSSAAVPLAAPGRRRHHRRRIVGARLPPHEGERAGLRAGLRREDGPAQVGFPHRAAERRRVRLRTPG